MLSGETLPQVQASAVSSANRRTSRSRDCRVCVVPKAGRATPKRSTLFVRPKPQFHVILTVTPLPLGTLVRRKEVFPVSDGGDAPLPIGYFEVGVGHLFAVAPVAVP